ncbi:MAG: hypothetical protein KTM48_03955 [Wolbachia endosymbiont of Pissodes strobi]|nr:hypothetical protein [Wolbachia endosymbiont of Pissodes strobi]
MLRLTPPPTIIVEEGVSATAGFGKTFSLSLSLSLSSKRQKRSDRSILLIVFS